MNMFDTYIIIVTFFISITLGVIIIPQILIISLRKRLFDQPDARKVHSLPIPRLGGVTFFPVIVFSFALFAALHLTIDETQNNIFNPKTTCEFLFLIAGLTLLYIVGIRDDLIGVKYRKKFLVQIISSSLLPVSGLYINSFYGLFGIYDIDMFIGIPLTILLTIFITNAINLIDGIDGLASGLSMVSLTIFGIIFACYGLLPYATLSFICVGIIIPFFIYNVFGNDNKGKKIFMGDTGSLTLGYILSFFVIKYCMYSPQSSMMEFGAPIIISFSTLLVPCLDVVRVVLKRARKKKALFLPDRSHIHHKFLAMGFSPHKAMITIQIMSTLFFIFSFIAIKSINITIVFITDIAIWTLLNVWFNRIIKRREL